MNTINFDKSKYESLKLSYKNSVIQKKDVFLFEGNELLTDYAKYLLEYLSTIFEKNYSYESK
jgi:hypothetical protein